MDHARHVAGVSLSRASMRWRITWPAPRVGSPCMCQHATTSTPGASLDGMAHAVWSPHEQELLNELLLEYPAEQSAPTERYIHIAAGIPNKTQQKQHFKAKEELPKKHSKAS
ncbi:hypothetical protein HaLaN_08823, partial [Haematococcus lacustris]